MLSIAKDKKNFKYQDPKGQINAILKSLVELNIYKNPHNTQTIRMSYVKLQISKMLKRYNRLLKVYWAINTKNTNYKQSNGIEEYSASDIQKIVIKLLENDYAKKVCKRTLELDIKLLNNLNLIKSKIIRFGKGKGSVAYYVQNMELMPTHKETILEYLTQLLQDNLKDKFIIGNFDFDKPFDNEPKNINSKINSKTTKLIKEKIESKNNEQLNKNRMSIISHVHDSDDINKANTSYIKEKNSKGNSEMILKKSDSHEKEKSKSKIKRKDIETRLLSEYKISKKYVKRIKEKSNNDSTYINALLNLEQAIIDYGIEYSLEDILEHFLKQFANRYKHKVWMMMKRKDGIISDYEVIWKERFRDWYSNKYKKRCVSKAVYGENICVGKKFLEKKGKKAVKNLQISEKEKAKKEEEHRLENKGLQEYLQRLFKQEAKEREERLRKAEEERRHLKNRARESMSATLQKNIGNNAQSNETDSLLYKTPPSILSESLSNEDIYERKSGYKRGEIANEMSLSEIDENVGVVIEGEEGQMFSKNGSLDSIISAISEQNIADNTGVNITGDVSNNSAPDISYRLLPKMDIEFETNYAVFKRTKGMSLSSLRIVVKEERNKIIKEKET